MSKKSRKKRGTYPPYNKGSHKTRVKYSLVERYGDVCWCCHQHIPRNKLTLHHIHKFCYTHHTTHEDSMILCETCHFEIVNRIEYDTDEYWDLMYDILSSVGRSHYLTDGKK